MRRILEWGLRAAAFLAVAAYLLPIAGWKGSAARRGAGVRPNPYFHSGKSSAGAVADPACQAAGCHVEYPHGKDPVMAPFRNMHQGVVVCLACHGQQAQLGWSAAGDDRRKLGYSPAEGKSAGKDPHALIGPPLSCRKCHSESGRDALAGRGIKDLPQGFSNPIALRMMEEGARRWVPETMR